MAIATDARDENATGWLFNRVEVGPVGVAVFNIGANVPSPLLAKNARKHRKIWEVTALAGCLTGREAARVTAPRGQGTILFTAGTASLRVGTVMLHAN
jgi:NAD(P)-dependent dehydrogenase (short-subunit alcohol dehydrogenase family)